MQKGSQAMNCYGSRTNDFLLVNYGFCFQNNLINSLKTNLRLDIDLNEPFTADDILGSSLALEGVQQIILKED